jgi:hypothetical protein
MATHIRSGGSGENEVRKPAASGKRTGATVDPTPALASVAWSLDDRLSLLLPRPDDLAAANACAQNAHQNIAMQG